MRSTSPPSMILALSCLVAFTAAAEVPPIPLIKTLDDLRHGAPVKLADGSEVRIGITESSPEGMPWRLVCCLPTDPNAGAVNVDGAPEERLGPVRVRIVRETPAKEVSGSIQLPEVPRIDGEAFYCIAVPVFDEGTFQVEVLNTKSADGKETPLFQTTIEAKKGAVCYWHRFAARTGNSDTIVLEPRAMRPRYSGMTHHFATEAKGDAPLDGFDVEHPLQLSLDLSVADPKLLVTSDAEMIDSPDEHLLARWWVNGEPVAAAPNPSLAMKRLIQHGWRISSTKEMHLAFALPRTLGPLKVGDRVSLQLMYSPAGSKPLFDKSMPDPRQAIIETFVPRIIAHPATLPRLSDKLEVTVTAEMLPKK